MQRRLAVAKAANETPERFGRLMDLMNRSGRVDGTYKLLQKALQGDAIRAEPPPLPQRGPYRVIVADPPWQYDVRQEDPSQRNVCPYPCLSDAEICALDVSSIAHANCILWLWTTNPRIPSRSRCWTLGVLSTRRC